ncbi:HNH endonuclease signature motif containing protein [Brachybacterium sp. HMSC06H03]|uniref:HNH endonuclease n=1 Tax=Brachybacterium sp. HMSC06H03 TaxID=1581127 RepID=UPI000A402BA2|nr:HNH endonuclease signature motif containing protein [Brachybacterium sp. HMSC06H03]
MTLAVQDLDAAAGDPHQQLVDAVRAGGPGALAEELGDRAHVLSALTGFPQELFTAADPSAEAFRDVIGSLHALRSAIDALEIRAVVALADSLTLRRQAEARAHAAQESGEEPPPAQLLRAASREAAREVSMLTRRSPASASRSLAARRRLVADMPVMLSAFADSQVTTEDAYRTARSFAPLTPAQRREADRLLGERLPYLDGAGSEEWADARAAAISLADPDGEARRHQHAKRDRHVTVRRGEHGMATVTAHVTALDAALIRKRLSLEAERLRAAGDRRGHQAIQADTFVDTLIGRSESMEPVTLDIGVIITDHVLLDPGTGDLAQIEGYGTVPAETVRESLRGPLDALIGDANSGDEALGPDGPALRAVLRRLYEHPRAEELVGVESRARAFPPALARFIRLRDRTCRGPHCSAPIRHIDHIRPHAAGGRTCLDNGQGACAYCNDKEQQLASVERVGDPAVDGHVVEWTTRLGTTRRTRSARLSAAEDERQDPPSSSEPDDVEPPPHRPC